MGAWNQSIYGGDTPIDWREKFYKSCGVDEYNDDDELQPISVEILTEKISEITKMIDSSSEEEDDKNVAYQVVAAIVMHAGFDFNESDGLKERVLEAIENDEWSKSDPVRKNVTKNYKQIVKDYDFNEPVNIVAVNVFEENEERDNEVIEKEFREIFGMMNARMKKLKAGSEEKSGVEEYDEGFADANEEEIEFLVDFKELLKKYEMMSILFEKVGKGLEESNPSSNTNKVSEKSTFDNSGSIGSKAGTGAVSAVRATTEATTEDSPGGKDIQPG